MFLILPIYSILPRIETLLIIQTVAISLSAIPIYLIALKSLKNQILSLTFAFVYLVNPVTQGMNWYDFHIEVFFAPLILFAIYYLKERKFLPFFIFLISSLTVIEWAPLLIAPMAVYIYWNLRDKKGVGPRKRLMISILTFALAIFWFFLALRISHTLTPVPTTESKAIANFSILGVSDVLEIPIKVITDPHRMLEALGYEAGRKLGYVLLLFAPTLFLAFFSPVALIPTISWFGFSLVSNYTPYYDPAFQYSGLIMAFLFVASIEGTEKLLSFLDNRMAEKIIRRVMVLMLFIIVILNVFASPLSPIFTNSATYFYDYGIPSPSQSDTSIRSVLETIPKDAQVLTMNRFFPHLSSSPSAYVIVPNWAFSSDLRNVAMKDLKKIDFEYIVISDLIDRADSENIYNEFVKDREYGVFARGTGIVVYKRGYTEKPIVNLPLRFCFSELSVNEGEVVDDYQSTFGKTIFYKPKFSQQANKIIWYGPYITLDEGNYTAKVRLKASQTFHGELALLDIVADYSRVKMTELKIYENDFNKPLEWRNFYMNFTISQRSTNIELRCFALTVTTNMWLDYIEIVER